MAWPKGARPSRACGNLSNRLPVEIAPGEEITAARLGHMLDLLAQMRLYLIILLLILVGVFIYMRIRQRTQQTKSIDEIDATRKKTPTRAQTKSQAAQSASLDAALDDGPMADDPMMAAPMATTIDEQALTRRLADALLGAGRVWRTVQQAGGPSGWPSADAVQLQSEFATVMQAFAARSDASDPRFGGAPQMAASIQGPLSVLVSLAATGTPTAQDWQAPWTQFAQACEQIAAQPQLRDWIVRHRSQ